MNREKSNTLIISVEPDDESVELPIGEVTFKQVMNIKNSEKFRIGSMDINNDFSDESDILNMIKHGNPIGKFTGIGNEGGFLYKFKLGKSENRESFINDLINSNNEL